MEAALRRAKLSSPQSASFVIVCGKDRERERESEREKERESRHLYALFKVCVKEGERV